MSEVFLTNMQLVKEGKLVCKQNKCRFYNNCDNYNCSYLELAELREAKMNKEQKKRLNHDTKIKF